MRKARYVSLVFLCLASTIPIFGQNAELSGTITDASSAVVSDASIRLLSRASGWERKTATNSQGVYDFLSVPAGTYDLEIAKQGFQTLNRTGIVLDVETHARLDFSIKVGDVAQSVTVATGSELLNITDASVSTVVDRQFVENIPLNGRSFQSLIALTPGVVTTPVSLGSEQGQFSVAGQRAGSNYFTIDGVSANFAASNGIFESQTANGGLPAFSALGSTASLVSIDALQEFRIETSTYAPEFGRQSGAQALLVTRSGSNQFHGTLFDYLRNDAFDSSDWFADSTGLPKPREHQNDFGGVLGGPILKDKTFFFFSYEGLRVAQPQTFIGDVPSLAARNAAPSSLKSLVNSIPLPNGPSTGVDQSQLSATVSNPSSLDAVSLRIDHTFNSRVTLFGRFNHSPSSTSEYGCGGTQSMYCTDTQQIDTGTLGVTAILTPTITNDFRFNYSRALGGVGWQFKGVGGAVVPPESAVVSPWQSLSTGWVFFGINGARNFQLIDGLGGNNLTRQMNITDSVAVIKGTHSMKFGFDFRRMTPVEGHPQTGVGYTWLSMSNFVRGVSPSVIDTIVDPKNLDLLFHNFSFFAQDTWRASRRLTLTYGVRWDYNPPPVVTSGNPPYVLSQITNLAAATLLPAGTSLWHADWKNFAPRFGLSYILRPEAVRSTVLRAGVGQFYDIGTSTAGSLDDGQGFYPYSLITYLCNFGTGPACNSSVPYSGPKPPFVFTQPYAGIMRAFDPHLKLPYSLQWNVALEQALSSNQTFKITYLGSIGRRLLRDDVVSNPNPILSGIMLTKNDGHSNYNALQLQFQRRLTHGLQALVSYTWSHSLDLSSTDVASPWGGTSVGVPSNLYNIRQDYGDSDFDVRHSLSAALTYNVPTPRLGNSLARAVLANWSIDSINTARTGTPFNAFYQPAVPEAFAGPTGPFDLRPDQVQGQPVWIDDSNAPGGKKLNPAAFTIPSVLRQGSEGRNSIRGFPLVELDLAIRRQFNVTERIRLQFRAEAFNFINHPNFGNPLNTIGTCALGVPCAPTYGWGTSQAMLNQSMGAGGSYGTPFNPLYQVGGPRSLQLSLKLQF